MPIATAIINAIAQRPDKPPPVNDRATAARVRAVSPAIARRQRRSVVGPKPVAEFPHAAPLHAELVLPLCRSYLVLPEMQALTISDRVAHESGMTASSIVSRAPGGRPVDVRGGIAHDLAVAIVSGVLKPGTALVSEGRFSAENGVSRGAYREAIRILAAKGLVHSRVKSTTRVNDRSQWSMLDSDVLGWMFDQGPDKDFISGIFELRDIVEPSAAALAAIRRSDPELAWMSQALEEMERHGLLRQEGRKADQAFHLQILAATRNEPLMTLSGSIAAAVEWTTRFARDERKQARDPMPDHRAVHAAITAGNADDARSAMQMLIRNARRDTGLI